MLITDAKGPAMPRPHCRRHIDRLPGCTVFKPAGRPVASLDVLTLSLDQLEALRLADLERLYHGQAAERMGVSRQTFGRILDLARNTVARALVEGMALRVEGGPVTLEHPSRFACGRCRHHWSPDSPPESCPACGSRRCRRPPDDEPDPAGEPSSSDR